MLTLEESNNSGCRLESVGASECLASRSGDGAMVQWREGAQQHGPFESLM